MDRWLLKYQNAQTLLEGREESMESLVESLENDMELLGVTGVEDKLQEDVATTIETARQAGVKVWMLTGDKIETATCIAISAGFKSRRQQMFYIKELETEKDASALLKEFERVASTSLLMVDGQSLEIIFSSAKLEERFFNITLMTPSVCICRCSPT